MENMTTVAVDLLAESFPRGVKNGEDVTDLAECVMYNGIRPDRLVVQVAEGPGGGNPFCHASFVDRTAARVWFAFVTDDNDQAWFEDNVV